MPASLSFAGELDLEAPRSAPAELTPGAGDMRPVPSTAYVPTSTLSVDPSADQRDRFADDADWDDDELAIDLTDDAPPPSQSRAFSSTAPTTSHSADLTLAPTVTTARPSVLRRLGLPIMLGLLGVALMVSDISAGPAARWETFRVAWLGVGLVAAAVLLLFWRLFDHEAH
jgi:hypothetical protein